MSSTPKLVVSLLVGMAIGAIFGVADATRNSSGTYSLPTGNPVVTGTAISSTVHNATMSDIGTELTASLERNGKGCMLAGLQNYVGTVSLPGITFCADTDTGFYRIGSNNVGLSLGGIKSVDFAASTASFAGSVTALGMASSDGGTFRAGAADTIGVIAVGNGTGDGIECTGGATSGDGITATGGATNGRGVVAQGTGSGVGIVATGGATNAAGGSFTGGATNGIGVVAQGTGSGVGVSATGGATNAAGVLAQGVGSGNGVTGVGGTTGYGVAGTGGANGGTGVIGTGGATDGFGVVGVGTAGGTGVQGSSTSGFGVSCYGNATSAPLVVIPQSAEPSATQNGQLYYDSDTNKLRLYAGGWVDLN